MGHAAYPNNKNKRDSRPQQERSRTHYKSPGVSHVYLYRDGTAPDARCRPAYSRSRGPWAMRSTAAVGAHAPSKMCCVRVCGRSGCTGASHGPRHDRGPGPSTPWCQGVPCTVISTHTRASPRSARRGAARSRTATATATATAASLWLGPGNQPYLAALPGAQR